ncbi:MAG: hypothetical protein AAGC70_19830, partial [Pseudomonadota bacterium]
MSVHHGERPNRECGACGARDQGAVLDDSESRALVSQELVSRELVSQELASKLARRPRANVWVTLTVLLLIATAVVVLLVESHNAHIADCQVETTSGGSVNCSLDPTDFVGDAGLTNVDLAVPDSRVANSGATALSQFGALFQPGTFQGHDVSGYDGVQGHASKDTQATDNAISIRPSLILDTGVGGTSRSSLVWDATETDVVTSPESPDPTQPPSNEPPDGDPPGPIIVPLPLPPGYFDPPDTGVSDTPGDMMGTVDTSISETEDGPDDLTIATVRNVTGKADGIAATEAEAGNLIINATHAIDVDKDGISASESGSGKLEITATGSIVTKTGHGISAAEADDGDLTIVASGDIMASADEKHGITARQDGAGIIDITTSGDLLAEGQNSDGIRTENAGGAGATMVNLNGGSVRGGDGTGAAVNFSLSGAGEVNTLNSSAHVSAASGWAVRGGVGNDIINNENGGVLSGVVDLADGNNAFNNKLGGRLEAGAVVNLGTHGILENAGVFALESDNTIGTTALTGQLIQTSTGRYEVDVALTTRESDRIDVTGAADLSGKVSVTLDKLVVGQQDFTIVTASGGVVRNGLAIDRIVTRSGVEISLNSQVVDVQLMYPNAN